MKEQADKNTSSLKNDMREMKEQADKNTSSLKNDMRVVNSRLNELSDKVENAKKKALEKENKDEKVLKSVQDRLEKIEIKLTEAENKCKEREKSVKENMKRTNEIKKSMGLEVEVIADEVVVKPKTWSEIMKDSKEKNDEKNAEDKARKVKTWKKQVEIKNKVKKLEETSAKKTATDLMEEKKVIEAEARKSALKMGDSPHHSEEDWSWDECEEEWEGTAEKKDAEKRKKIERYRKKKLLESKTANKARHILGLGPIRKESIGYFYEVTADWEHAKKLAVNEYLEAYLQFNTDDINDFEVLETMTSKSDDEVLYVTFAEIDAIKEIHRRVAEVRNKDIMIRNYIPPQFWERYRWLSQYCSDLRGRDPDLKTRIQFNEKDLEVLTKRRRAEDTFKVMSMKVIEEKGEIPRFDHSITWKRRSDRPPRNPTKTVEGKVCPPSLRQGSLQRQRSSSNSVSSPKRQKTRSDSDCDPLEVVVVEDSPVGDSDEADHEDRDEQDMDL